MKVINTHIDVVKIIEPTVFGDDRGYFCETWHQQRFEHLVTAKPCVFVQDNHSMSIKGTLRGLHFQRQQTQGKLIRVTSGQVFDVAVDLRSGSTTYGQWVGEILSAENQRQLWVPAGFAHGFFVLSDKAECLYKCTDYYHPQSEECIQWNDPTLNIQWPLNGIAPKLSAKDTQGKKFTETGAL